jgi:elongation factor P hydroxylase
MPQSPQNLALALCQRLSIPTSPDKPGAWQWTGRVLCVGGQKPQDIVHDAAHWLVAPPWRRRCPDFGLGRGPDTELWYLIGPNELRVKSEYAQLEEEQASLLGVFYLAALGLNYRATLMIHNWDLEPDALSGTDTVLIRTVAALRRKKLIHSTGRPTRGLLSTQSVYQVPIPREVFTYAQEQV